MQQYVESILRRPLYSSSSDSSDSETTQASARPIISFRTRKLPRGPIPSRNFDAVSNLLLALDLASETVKDYDRKEWEKVQRKREVDRLQFSRPVLLNDEMLLLKALNVFDETLKFLNLEYRVHSLNLRKRTGQWISEFFEQYMEVRYRQMATVAQPERIKLFSKFLDFFTGFMRKFHLGKYLKYYNGFLTNLRKNFPTDSHWVMKSVLDFTNCSTLLCYSLEFITDYVNLDFLLYHARRERMPYFYLWTGVGDGYMGWEDYVAKNNRRAPQHGILGFTRIEHVEILLNYGFRFQFIPDSTDIMIDAIDTYRNGTQAVLRRDASRILDSFNHRQMMATYIFCVLIDCDWKNKIKIFRLIMRSCPEPFITTDEMYQAVTKLVVPRLCPDVWNVCLDYEGAQVYGEPEGYTVPLPRRLLHLARCAIRFRLRQNLQLPVGIEELGLPEPMRDYLHMRS